MNVDERYPLKKQEVWFKGTLLYGRHFRGSIRIMRGEECTDGPWYDTIPKFNTFQSSPSDQALESMMRQVNPRYRG